MNKTLIMCTGALLIGMASCDTGDFTQESSFITPVINLITDLSTGETTATTGDYTFATKFTSSTQTGSVSSTQLVYNNNTMTLRTDNAPYESYGYDVIFKNLTGQVTGNMNYPVSGSLFYASPFYFYSNAQIGEYTYNYNQLLYAGVIQYTMGNEYSVKTFPQHAFFFGETHTSYGASTNVTDEILYRVDIYSENNESKARMIMYNAKFSDSPGEPTKTAILLEGLELSLSPNSIVITGDEITPKVFEAGGWTEYPTFVFDNISFTTTDPYLVKASINYKVAGIYSGSFSGSYLEESTFNLQ